MASMKDLTGQRFGKLVAIKPVEKEKNKYKWLCQCDCGNEKIVVGTSLSIGNTKTCGQCPINKYITVGDLTVGFTSNSEAFLIDTEDYDKISKHTWHNNGKGYICTWNNGREVKLHRFLLNASKDIQVDHKNGDTMNYCRKNLRLCTNAENQYNRKKSQDKSSKYKGVCYHKGSHKWRARITVNYKLIHLGSFVSEIAAALAYNDAASKYFGEFSRLNEVAA